MWRINEVDLTSTTPKNVVYAFIIACDLPRCITTNEKQGMERLARALRGTSISVQSNKPTLTS